MEPPFELWRRGWNAALAVKSGVRRRPDISVLL